MKAEPKLGALRCSRGFAPRLELGRRKCTGWACGPASPSAASRTEAVNQFLLIFPATTGGRLHEKQQHEKQQQGQMWCHLCPSVT